MNTFIIRLSIDHQIYIRYAYGRCCCCAVPKASPPPPSPLLPTATITCSSTSSIQCSNHFYDSPSAASPATSQQLFQLPAQPGPFTDRRPTPSTHQRRTDNWTGELSRINSYVLHSMLGSALLYVHICNTTLWQMKNYHFLCWIGLNEVYSFSYISPACSSSTPTARLSLASLAVAPAATPQWLEWIVANVKRC